METRCLLAYVALLIVMVAPVMSFPARTNEKSRDHAGITSLLRMLKDQILNRSQMTGTTTRESTDRGRQLQSSSPRNFKFVPMWSAGSSSVSRAGWPLGRKMPHTTDLADVPTSVLDRDISPATRISEDEKRGSDYGHGMFFGKRVPSRAGQRQNDDAEAPKQETIRDYNWGMMFGKRGHNDAYGWGGFFGKRSGDVIEYEDFVA